MKEFINKILSAFDNHSKGFSARKLSAFTIVVCVFVAHIAYIKNCFINNDFKSLESILIIDYGFISTMLGLTVYESIKKGNTEPPTEEPK